MRYESDFSGGINKSKMLTVEKCFETIQWNGDFEKPLNPHVLQCLNCVGHDTSMITKRAFE